MLSQFALTLVFILPLCLENSIIKQNEKKINFFWTIRLLLFQSKSLPDNQKANHSSPFHTHLPTNKISESSRR